MDDTVTDLPFPLSGVFAAGEYGAPPGMTAVKGVNVRGYDPIARRLRGGSRPGLTKFLPVATPAGTHLIQHLDVIVDPTVDALPADFDNAGPTPTYPDPTDPARNPYGRLVRAGGSGVGLLRHKKPTPGRFVQKQGNFVGIGDPDGSTTAQATFDNPVTAGNLIVVTLQYNPGPVANPVFDAANVTDTAGTSYAKAAEGTGSLTAVAIFYGIVPVTGSGPNTVTARVTTGATGNGGTVEINVLEYRRVAQSGPLADAAAAGGLIPTAGTPFVFTPGPVQTTRDDSIVVAVVYFGGGPGPLTTGPQPAFTTDPQLTNRDWLLTGRWVFDLIPVEASLLGIKPTWTTAGTETQTSWAVAAASFSPP